jgi:hypothetical protein
MVRRYWPIILKHAEGLIFIDAFNKGGIKDIFRDYDVYCGNVRRITPDGRLLIPQHSKPSRLPTPQEMREEQPMLDLTMKARNPELLRKLFDEYLRWRFERINVPQSEIDAFRERHIAYIMNEMHIDVVRDKNVLIPHTDTTAHARSGFNRKFDYDGKLYGLWIGVMRIRTLTLADEGPEILAWILLEEAQHFSPDGIVYESHSENREQIYTKTNDYLEMVEHGTIFESMMSFFNSSLEVGRQNYPNFSTILRDYTLQRSNNPIMLLLDESVRYFLDTNLRVYLENPAIPLQDKIQKVKQDIVVFITRYGSLQDEKILGFARGISNGILS